MAAIEGDTDPGAVRWHNTRAHWVPLSSHHLHLTSLLHTLTHTRTHRYSSAHYVTAVQDIPELSSAHTSTQGPGSLIGILRLDSLSSHSPGAHALGTGAGAGTGFKYPGMGGGTAAKPHFDVFCTDSRLTEILTIESGRQNCFMSIIVFLLKSLKAATDGQVSHYRGGGGKYVAPVIEEACLEVFQTRDIDSLIEYLGFDCTDT